MGHSGLDHGKAHIVSPYEFPSPLLLQSFPTLLKPLQAVFPSPQPELLLYSLIFFHSLYYYLLQEELFKNLWAIMGLALQENKAALQETRADFSLPIYAVMHHTVL